MARRLSAVAFVLLLLLVCLEARKLSWMEKESLILNQLIKGPTPPSSPSGSGNEVNYSKKKISGMHLARSERFLEESVPSPGAGHAKLSSQEENV
ncbi:hypothetical protein MANES_15G096175v8 [Manihot esculenta]|uniref:Uncharacterized protein n=1 Tax=Manihot esculenta TaxID=3983 RepID=A0ACB7GES3_MANES|nr:hypothetical protein MANES_15G096175v8 [Manihot esculenta]